MKVVCKNNVEHSLFDEDEYEFTILLNIIRKYQGGAASNNWQNI
jgi:hypothetical protein